MADIETKQKELLLDLVEDMDWDSRLGECPGVDAVAMTEMSDYEKERMEEELAKYIDDKNNYVVEGAIVECDQMSKQPVQMYYTNGKLGIKGEGGSAEIEYKIPQYGVSLPCFELDPNETEIRAFHAINSSQGANGLRFATVSDRSCLRDKIEKENMEEGKDVANLISMGNCKIMLDSDVLEINNRKGRAKIFGTCYCLMKPDTRWVNPYCMEGLVENCSKESAHVRNCYVDEHHHTMNWDTDAGQKEGLTRLSTLLCTRGGIITFTWSGQCSEDSINIEMALDKMTEYLQGKGISEEELNDIIAWLANNCGLTVNDMVNGDFCNAADAEAYNRSQKFDNQIIAWTYYWNVKIQKEFEPPFTIDPNIVKAIIAQESSFGLVTPENKAKNPSRNVMQSLAVGNDTVWVASGINPFHNKIFSVGDNIAYKMLDGTVGTDGCLVGKKEKTDLSGIYMDKDKFEKYRKDQHYDDFDILKDIFEIGEDGKYMVVFDNVTPDMSIATGIGCLANKMEYYHGSISKGVMAYNTEDNVEYLGDINQHLVNMGCNEIKP